MNPQVHPYTDTANQIKRPNYVLCVNACVYVLHKVASWELTGDGGKQIIMKGLLSSHGITCLHEIYYWTTVVSSITCLSN